MPHPTPHLHLFRFLAISYILFLIAIVILINQSENGHWWTFIHTTPYADKLGHLGLTATLGFLCNLAFTKKPLSLRPTRITLILLLIVSLEEISQVFIPTRNFDLLDMLANSIGLALGQLAATGFQKILHNLPNNH
ncbi:MAG: VanZ family protein [Luteolibacter sp.]